MCAVRVIGRCLIVHIMVVMGVFGRETGRLPSSIFPIHIVRTNFIVAPGMSLDRLDHGENFQWAVRMFDRLGEEGFPEVSDVCVVDRKRRWAQFNA